jgi:hypothetical protein
MESESIIILAFYNDLKLSNMQCFQKGEKTSQNLMLIFHNPQQLKFPSRHY